GGGGGGGFGGPKGGGGGGGPKGGKGLSSTSIGEPDFFEQRVTDDPQPILYDPRIDVTVPALSQGAEAFVSDPPAPAGSYQPIQLATFGEKEKQPAKGKEKEKAKDGEPQFDAPRLPVIVESLEGIGGIVIRANNPEDMERAQKIIEYILKEGAKTQ